MKKVLVVGTGRVGATIAKELHFREFDVTAVDTNPKALATLYHRGIKIDTQWVKHLDGADIVVGAVPGHTGFQILERAISAGKDVVDISFFPENPWPLDELAQKHGVTAVIDCGIAPGTWNMILGHFESKGNVGSCTCYVGGLPVNRHWPHEYKAGFSPIDVIEEYTRPARYRFNGKTVTKPALSEAEYVDFKSVTLEAFNTDGLRTLLETSSVPNLKEMTLRYPGHIEKMRFLRDAGFFSHVRMVNGVAPIEMTAEVMFPDWTFESGEKDVTFMRIDIDGRTIDMIDHADDEEMSMSRTTGYMCTATVEVLAQGLIKKKGLVPPEYLGHDYSIFREIMFRLAGHNIRFTENGSGLWWLSEEDLQNIVA